MNSNTQIYDFNCTFIPFKAAAAIYLCNSRKRGINFVEEYICETCRLCACKENTRKEIKRVRRGRTRTRDKRIYDKHANA